MKILASKLENTAIRPIHHLFRGKKMITAEDARLLFYPDAVCYFDKHVIQPFLASGGIFVFYTEEVEAHARVVIDTMFPNRDVPLFVCRPEKDNPDIFEVVHGDKHGLIRELIEFFDCSASDITILDDDDSMFCVALGAGCNAKYANIRIFPLNWAIEKVDKLPEHLPKWYYLQ